MSLFAIKPQETAEFMWYISYYDIFLIQYEKENEDIELKCLKESLQKQKAWLSQLSVTAWFHSDH